jgi:hypothetical protein
MMPHTEVNSKHADGRQSPTKAHRRSDSPRSSWGEGVKLTRNIFENFIPYAEVKERTVDDVTKAFHDKNQSFLKATHITQKPAGDVPHYFGASPR